MYGVGSMMVQLKLFYRFALEPISKPIAEAAISRKNSRLGAQVRGLEIGS